MLENAKKTRNSLAAIIAAICTVVFITAITLLGELVPKLKDWLKNAFTHHWLGKSLLAGALYAIIYILVLMTGKEADERSLATHIRILSWLAILGTLIIFGFFAYETFWK